MKLDNVSMILIGNTRLEFFDHHRNASIGVISPVIGVKPVAGSDQILLGEVALVGALLIPWAAVAAGRGCPARN